MDAHEREGFYPMTTAPISEKSSEKRKRGRPERFPPQLLEVYRQGSDGYTRRAHQNTGYHVAAFQALGDDPAYEWLMDPKTGKVRRSILAELGRLEDPDAIRDIAGQICELRLKAADAIMAVRAVRLGKKAAADEDDLYERLVAFLDRYQRHHEGDSWQMVAVALDRAGHLAHTLARVGDDDEAEP